MRRSVIEIEDEQGNLRIIARLQQVNARLLEALKKAILEMERDRVYSAGPLLIEARAAIASATPATSATQSQ